MVAATAVTLVAPEPGSYAHAIANVRDNLAKRAADFTETLPQGISVGKFQASIMAAVANNPELLRADRQSLFIAATKAAQDGLLPDGREAAFVVFKTSKKVEGQWVQVSIVQYMPMVYGLRKKILQSGEISDISCNVVYRAELESGAFIYEEGSNATLRHRPSMMLTAEQTTDDQIVVAYSVATMKDGTRSVEVMRRFEIDRVRQTSQTGAEGQVGKWGSMRDKPIEPKGPWVDWYPEMAKKTVMRRHSKSLPMSGDITDIGAMDDARAAQSTVALMDQVAPDAPQRIVEGARPIAEGARPMSDEGFGGFDGITGEVIDAEPAGAGAATSAATGVTTGAGQPLPDAKPANDPDFKAAEPRKRARKPVDKPVAAPAPDGPAPDGSDTALPGEQEDAVAGRIEAAITAAATVLEVANIALMLPSELTDEARAYLLAAAETRKSELRAAAVRASANG